MEQSKILKLTTEAGGSTTLECDLQTGKCSITHTHFYYDISFFIPIPEGFANSITEQKIFQLMKLRNNRSKIDDARMRELVGASVPSPNGVSIDPSYTIIIINYQGKEHEISGCRIELERIPLISEFLHFLDIVLERKIIHIKSGYNVAKKQPWFKESDLNIGNDEIAQKAWYVWRTLCQVTEKPTKTQIEDVCSNYGLNFYDAMKWKNRFILKIRKMKQQTSCTQSNVAPKINEL